jgi:predicted transcriptional regulator
VTEPDPVAAPTETQAKSTPKKDKGLSKKASAKVEADLPEAKTETDSSLEAATDPSLNEIEATVLAFVIDQEAAALSEIESELSLSRFKAVDALRSLVEAGHLEKHSESGKPTLYRLSAN